MTRLPPLLFLLAILSFWTVDAVAQDAPGLRIATVKYAGGGDWYQGQTPLPEFLSFVRENTLIDVAAQADVVELNNDKLFGYPFLFMSGHGNVSLTDSEVQRLRRYLTGGGFLYIDDDYGLDEYVRREMKKVFPGKEFVELPFSHDIFHAHYDFPNGLPKIHEHDGNAPRGLGLFEQGRLVVFYTFETNISDGWEAPAVHDLPPEKRMAALQMGTNILTYALIN